MLLSVVFAMKPQYVYFTQKYNYFVSHREEKHILIFYVVTFDTELYLSVTYISANKSGTSGKEICSLPMQLSANLQSLITENCLSSTELVSKTYAFRGPNT